MRTLLPDALVRNRVTAYACCSADAADKSIQASIYGDTATAQRQWKVSLYMLWAQGVMKRRLQGCVTEEFACAVVQKADPLCTLCACSGAASNPVTPVPPCDIQADYRVSDTQDASQQPSTPTSRSIFIVSNTVPVDNEWAAHVGDIVTGTTYVTPPWGSIILNAQNSVYWSANPTEPGLYFPPYDLDVINGTLTLVSAAPQTSEYLLRQVLIEGYNGSAWVTLYSGIETAADGYTLSSGSYSGIRTTYIITKVDGAVCTYGPYPGTVDTTCQLVNSYVAVAKDANFQNSAVTGTLYYIVSNQDSLITSWGTHVGSVVVGGSSTFTAVTAGQTVYDPSTGIYWTFRTTPGQLFPVINGLEVTPGVYEFTSEYPSVNGAEGRNIKIDGLIGSTWTELYAGAESNLSSPLVVTTASIGATSLRTSYIDGPCTYRYYTGTVDQGEVVTFVSNRSTNFSAQFRTTTGRIAVTDWTGTTTVYGTGNPVSTITVSFTVPSSGPFSGTAPKTVSAYPVTAASATAYGGGVTLLDVTNIRLSSLDVSTCQSLLFLTAPTNQLTSLVLHHSAEPQSVSIGGNLLTSFSVNSSVLSALSCSDNQLTTLTITGADTSLTDLRCLNNQLTALDVSSYANLQVLWCRTNPLGSLDVTQNTALTSLICSANQLTTLDLTQNVDLVTLDCSNNSLSTIDLSANTALISATVSNNLLPTLDVSLLTQLVTLQCGNNLLLGVDVSANTLLQTLGCNNNSLSGLPLTANTALVTLNCANNAITSLSLSANTSLVSLTCNDNRLTTLDVSANTLLQTLIVSNNLLTTMDISANDALRTYQCDNNTLGAISVSDKPQLRDLRCSNTGISALNVSANTLLQRLYCNSNALTTLDVSANTGLLELSCSSNQFTSLNVANHTSLSFLVVSNNAVMTSLNCSGCAITDMRVNGCVALNTLNCSNNAIIAQWIDALFVPLPTTPAGTVNCSGGTNAVPTATSAAKRTLLTTAGWSLVTN